MKAQWKKLFSVLVAFALVITMLPVQSAEAAGAPKLSTTKKTLLVGSKTTLKVKNVASNAKLTWKSSNADAVAVSQKGLVKAKKGGESVVSCKVQTGSKVYTLKADITVKDSVVVATQKALKKALANEGITKIKIKTDAKKKFTISKGDYTNKLLIVEAPKADVSNNGGVFKRIAIRSISPNTWIERAAGNKFSISAPESRIVVGKNASVKTISFTEAGAAAKVDVRGEVAKVAVKAPVALNVVGTGKEVNVVATEAAKGATIVAEVPVNVTTSTDVKVELGKGAEGSTVATTNNDVKVEVTNGTTSNVVVSTPAGEQTVNAGSSTSGSNNTTSSGNTTTGGGSSSGGSSSGGSTVTKKYELEQYGRDLEIIPADSLTEEDITVNASSWEIRLTKEVATGAAIDVEGSAVLVDGEKIVTLPSKTAITGTDANGNIVNGTAGIRWIVESTGVNGVCRVVGILTMPSGWANTYNKGIALSLIATSLVSEDLYEVKYIGDNEETFVLTPAADSKFVVTSANGVVTISSTGVLDGELLSVADSQLKYDGEVIGTLPTKVWVEGPQVKGEIELYKAEELELTWWSTLMYNSANGTYAAMANIKTNENWVDVNRQAAAMVVVLKSSAVEVSALNIWNEADAELYAANCLTGASITAAVVTGSAVTVSGAADVNVDGENRTTVTYTLAGTLPYFTLGDVEGRYVLFSLEKSTVSGIWMGEGVNEDYPITEGGMYTFDGSSKIIVCLDIADTARFGLWVDVDGDGTFSSGDVRYIIDGTNVAQ